MNSNSYYWQGQHLATFKSGFLIGRGCANKPGVDGYLSNQIAGLKGQDVIRDHLAAGVATLAGAGVAPRWSGLVGFAGKPGVDLGDELRQLVYSADYGLYDLLWLNRDRSPDFDRLAWDAGAWSSETDARKREGQRKSLIRGFDWADLAGCLVLLGDSRQRLTDAARKGLGRDVDLMLDSYHPKAPARAERAAEKSLALYCLRLAGVDVEWTQWAMIADQKPDWGLVARLYRRCSGVDVSAKDLADGLRRRFKALERKTSVIEPSKHWDFDAENRCLAPENEGFTGSERKTSVIEPSKHWDFDAENRCIDPDAGDRCLTLLPEEGLSVRHRPLSPVSTVAGILPAEEGNKYPPPYELLSQRFIGVDPGLGERAPGGLALISEDGLVTWRMPRGDDVEWLREVVKLAVDHRALIFVERVDTRGSMSVPGAFTFGRAAERAELGFLLAGLTIERIQPAWWKPALGLSKDSTLEQRRARLSELLDERFDIKPDLSGLTDGEVDASLVACAGALKTAPAVRLDRDMTVDVEGGDAALSAAV